MASYSVNPAGVAHAREKWRHKEVELAAHALLQELDRVAFG
jgi:hypothetical protein